MNSASHALSPAPSTAPLHPAIIRRRRPRPLLLAPPSAHGAAALASVIEPASWPSDLRFFVGCYVAGLVFFLIMLS